VAQVSPEPLIKLRHLFGGTISHRSKGAGPANRKHEIGTWTVTGGRARGVMLTVYANVGNEAVRRLHAQRHPLKPWIGIIVADYISEGRGRRSSLDSPQINQAGTASRPRQGNPCLADAADWQPVDQPLRISRRAKNNPLMPYGGRGLIRMARAAGAAAVAGCTTLAWGAHGSRSRIGAPTPTWVAEEECRRTPD
jgi:hypothetical protein